MLAAKKKENSRWENQNCWDEYAIHLKKKDTNYAGLEADFTINIVMCNN